MSYSTDYNRSPGFTLLELEALPAGTLILCEGSSAERPSAWVTLGGGKAVLLWEQQTEDLEWFHYLAVSHRTRISVLGSLQDWLSGWC